MPYDATKTHHDDVFIDKSLDYRAASYKTPALSYRRHGKRFLDIVLVLLSLVVTVPLVALAAALAALDGHSPFYLQTRIGLNRRRFRIVKIRTMVPDADAVLKRSLEADPALEAEWMTTQKLKNDARITPIGRILRKTSLDELPQLWNVFNGSMSLVGPRPMMIGQQALYPGVRYYNLRPGITGFWQISERNDCDFRDRAIHDDAYDRSLSFWTDLRVLFRTVRVVLKGTGY